MSWVWGKRWRRKKTNFPCLKGSWYLHNCQDFKCLLQGKRDTMGAEDLFSLELQEAIILTLTFPSVQSLDSARIWLSNCQCQKLDCILLKWLLLPNRKIWTHRCLHRSLPYFSRPRAALSTNQAVKCFCRFCVSCPALGLLEMKGLCSCPENQSIAQLTSLSKEIRACQSPAVLGVWN